MHRREKVDILIHAAMYSLNEVGRSITKSNLIIKLSKITIYSLKYI